MEESIIGLAQILRDKGHDSYSLVFGGHEAHKMTINYIFESFDRTEYKSLGSIGLYDKNGNLLFILEQVRKME